MTGSLRIVYIWILSALSLLLLMGACSRAETTGNGTPLPPKEFAMASGHATTVSRTSIPPIDAVAPQTFETASFGLG